jgi:hypothetical protein
VEEVAAEAFGWPGLRIKTDEIKVIKTTKPKTTGNTLRALCRRVRPNSSFFVGVSLGI